MTEVARLQAFLRDAAQRGHTVVRVGPFLGCLHADDPLRFFNYAVPDDGADPSTEDVEALRLEFRAHDRLPRLEWIEEAAPLVADALAAAGMREELRTPLMACSPDDLVEAAAAVEQLTVRPLDDENFPVAAELQRLAFGTAVPTDTEPYDPRTHGGGGVLAHAGDIPVAGAAWTGVADGVTEIVGVATAVAWRRRGLAGAVTAAATRSAFAAGASLAILSPGDDTAQRVYERAGFRRTATMLHWSDPD